MIINRATHIREGCKDGIFAYLDEYILGPLNLIDSAEYLIMWITRRNGGHRFKIIRPIVYGGSGNPKAYSQCEKMLKDIGIKTYACKHSAHYMYFSVSSTQAEWAEYALLRFIPEQQLENPTGGRAANVRTASKHGAPVKPWKHQAKSERRPRRQRPERKTRAPR